MQPLLIFDVTVADHIMMNRNRVGVQTIVKRIMDKYSYAFMIFHYDNDTQWDWRFSYCHKGSKESDTTESKRFTFLLGPGQSCLTAASNFMKLEAKHGDISNDDLETAFSVEALSNEFFDKYKKRYEKFVSYITGKAYVKSDGKYMEKVVNTNNDKVLYAAFGNDDKRVRDYVKRLLGRIVFLHFLQKKGWLGLPDGEDWDSGKGDLDFMRRLYNEASPEQQDDFLDTVLEPLFSAIDTNRSASNYLYDTKVLGRLRVPYLNGGLFERNADDEIPSRFPKEYFADLLEFFSQYNFTVDENDPNDAQVGIDPEMLSRIFENLLEDNKDKGAYYTPKEVVHYMCRESLIAYLQTSYDEDKCKAIRKFVETHNASTIESFKKDIDTRLQEVKICDPAIGSGAFPMGMLKEIFLCRCALEEVTDNAEIKRQIIQNNIYGVDIEKGAVEIARLRFWLTLIVDEKSPETLPNLDFKIMQGNSLLESYEGIDLSRLSVISDIQFFEPQRNLLGEIENREIKIAFTQSDELRDFQENVNSYFAVNDHAERLRLRNAIEDYLRKTIKQTLERYQRGEEIYIENIITTNITLNQRQKKVIEARAKVIPQCKKIIADLPQMEMTNSHFFLWHTWFNDVFSRPSKEGFDIVIGNPPYISAPAQLNNKTLSKQRHDIVESKIYKTLHEKWDLYVPFMELGLHLLANKGIFSMIVPYPLTNQKYAKKLRKLITERICIMEIADLSDTKIFENATVSNCIPILRKDIPAKSLPIVHINDKRQFFLAFNKPISKLIQDDKTYVWNLTTEQRQGKRFPNMHVLGDYCYISVGMVLNADEKTAKGDFSKDDLISETKDEVHSRKYIEAKDIDKYKVNRVRFLEWNTERCPGKLRRPTFKELYEQPKLIFNRLGSLKVYLDIEAHYLHSDSIFSAVPWKYLKGINNKSISASVKRYSRLTRIEMEKLSESINLYYLLAILNSSMADKLLADQRGGDYHIYPEHLRNIPIASASADVQIHLGELAKTVLECKACGKETDAIEEEIDLAVSKLYTE